MTLGLTVSFIVTFLLLPSLLNIFADDSDINFRNTEKSIITSFLGSIAKKSKIFLFGASILVIALSFIEFSNLRFENSFINYFDKETEIYKGMKKIDEELGGTTPLNVIIKFPKNKILKMMMNFLSGMKIQKTMRINLNIGLQEIKWIKF